MVDARGLATDRLRRWRAWRRWFLPVAPVAIATAVLAPWIVVRILGGVVVVLGALRDLQLGIRLFAAMTRAVWGRLTGLERGWLRAEVAAIGLVFLSLWLCVTALIAYLFSGHVPVRWNTFAFTLFGGAFGLGALLGGRRWIAAAFQARPGFEADAVEVMRIQGNAGSPEEDGE
jgi:hypothetical protein